MCFLIYLVISSIFLFYYIAWATWTLYRLFKPFYLFDIILSEEPCPFLEPSSFFPFFLFKKNYGSVEVNNRDFDTIYYWSFLQMINQQDWSKGNEQMPSNKTRVAIQSSSLYLRILFFMFTSPVSIHR